MPNWVKNIVSSSEETMKKIREKYFENGVIDFNKIIPMPKTLNLTEGGITETAIFYAICKKDKKTQKEICELLKNTEDNLYGNYLKAIHHYYKKGRFENIESSAKKFVPEIELKKLGIVSLEQLGDTYINNIRKYGCKTWYDWSIKNWGTKWNASNCVYNKEIMIFETAWDTPHDIFEKISLDFPNELIEVKYADEDYYSDNNGILRYKNGLIECQEGLGEKFALSIWQEEIINVEVQKNITDELFD